MFGGGFRVGVTVSRVELPSADPGTTPPGAIDRPSRLGDVLPVAVRSDGEIAADLERLVQIRAALAAYEAELVVELAGRRPDSMDIPRGARREAGVDASDPLAAGVSEFFCDEIAVIAQCSPTAATALIEQSFTLRSRLPRVWAALADGLLDHPRARALATELGRPADGTDQSVIAEVEQAVLPHALAGMSVRRLRDLAKKELLARDAASAERRRKLAERASNVLVRPLADGMAELVAAMPAPAAAAVRDAVDRYAQMLRADGDSHPIGILRAQVLHDLVLRPWDSSRPAVTAHLSILAPLAALGATMTTEGTSDGEAAPTAEVDGQTITAAHLARLLAHLDAYGVQAPPGGTLDVAVTDATGKLIGAATHSELRKLVRRGCARHPETDCGCPVLEKPPAVDRYRPTPLQRRFVSTRDRTCRHPGCRNKAGWADLDHVLPHAEGGATDCENLCCLCRRHHRLKTDARGWLFRMEPDGTLTVTTPSGVTRSTRPPGLDSPDPVRQLRTSTTEALARPGPDLATEAPPF